MAEYPPELLAADPVALYGRTDEPGNGPVQIVQRAPIMPGDQLVRSAGGAWINTAAGAGGDAWLANLRQAGNAGRPARSNLSFVTGPVESGALAGSGIG